MTVQSDGTQNRHTSPYAESEPSGGFTSKPKLYQFAGDLSLTLVLVYRWLSVLSQH